MNEYAGRTPDTGIRSRILYGIAEFYGGGAFLIISTFYTVFMIKAMGMPPALAGTAPLLGHVWDAITDPIMGNITDRTVSKHGAKRFYIFIGAIASSLTFVCMWIAVPSESNVVRFIFYMLMYCLFSTGFTILMVPYNGLLPDMIDDYTMRAKFSNVRMIFSTLGAMVCGIAPAVLIADNLDTGAYFRNGIVFGIVFFITSVLTFLGTWEKKKPPVRTRLSESFPQAASVFQSKSFRLFIGLYLFGQCGMDFVSGMAVYYVDDVLNGYENGYFTYILGALMVFQLIGMFVFGPAMSKTSKRTVILIGAPIRLVALLALLFISYEGANIVPILAMAALIGFGNAACLTGIFAVMADMADVDELITSVHRPGMVSGMATFSRKISSGLSSAAIGVLLAMVGYDEVAASAGIRQTLETQRGIGLIFVFAPAILTLLLMITAFVFPLTGKEFRILQKEIARRKGEEASAATEEERRVCEKVTGFSFDRLWDKKNAKMQEKEVTPQGG